MGVGDEAHAHIPGFHPVLKAVQPGIGPCLVKILYRRMIPGAGIQRRLDALPETALSYEEPRRIGLGDAAKLKRRRFP
jgi:hypothetical protein